jgi:hypothetical protein
MREQVANQLQSPTERVLAFLNWKYVKNSREEWFQELVLSDLLPVIEPGQDPQNLQSALFKLISAINEKKLQPRWVITPAAIKKRWRPGERVIRIQNTRWVLSKVSFASDNFDAMYLDIISSLERGEFGKIRRCPECRIFFLAKNFTRKFCSPECYAQNDRKRALNRVKNSRKKQTVNMKKRGLSTLRRILPKRPIGRSCPDLVDLVIKSPELQKTRNKLKENWTRFVTVILDCFDEPAAPEKIWKKLPKRIQRVLAEPS